MLELGNRVSESATASGTGAFTLQGASESQYRTFAAAFSTGAKVPYVAVQGSVWEVGYGTLTSSTSLTRDVAWDTSAATGINSGNTTSTSKVSFDGGTSITIFNAVSANVVLVVDENGMLIDGSPFRRTIFLDEIEDMTALEGLSDGETVIVTGTNGGIFRWDADSVTAADDVDIFENDNEDTGRHIRCYLQVQGDFIESLTVDAATGGDSHIDLFTAKKASNATKYFRWRTNAATSALILGARLNQASLVDYLSVYSLGTNADRLVLEKPTVLPGKANLQGLKDNTLVIDTTADEIAVTTADAADNTTAADSMVIPRVKGTYLLGAYETITDLKAIDAAKYAKANQRALCLGRADGGDIDPFYVEWFASNSDSNDDWLTLRPSTGAAASGNGRWKRVTADISQTVSNSATPSIVNGSFIILNSAASHPVTDIGGEYSGATVVLQRGDEDVTIVHDAAKIDNGGEDLNLTVSSPRAVYMSIGGVWRLIGGGVGGGYIRNNDAGGFQYWDGEDENSDPITTWDQTNGGAKVIGPRFAVATAEVDTTSGSNTITIPEDILITYEGAVVSGSGIPVGATITTPPQWFVLGADYAREFTISAVATATASNVSITCTYTRDPDETEPFMSNVPDYNGDGLPDVDAVIVHEKPVLRVQGRFRSYGANFSSERDFTGGGTEDGMVNADGYTGRIYQQSGGTWVINPAFFPYGINFPMDTEASIANGTSHNDADTFLAGNWWTRVGTVGTEGDGLRIIDNVGGPATGDQRIVFNDSTKMLKVWLGEVPGQNTFRGMMRTEGLRVFPHSTLSVYGVLRRTIYGSSGGYIESIPAGQSYGEYLNHFMPLGLDNQTTTDTSWSSSPLVDLDTYVYSTVASGANCRLPPAIPHLKIKIRNEAANDLAVRCFITDIACTTTSGSAFLTGLPSGVGSYIMVGQRVTGTNIQANTLISSLEADNNGRLVIGMSKTATGTGSVTVSVAGLDSVNGAAGNASYMLSPGFEAEFMCHELGQWRATMLRTGGIPTTVYSAYSGGGRTNATAIVASYARFTTVAASGDSAVLPAATTGKTYIIENAATHYSMQLFAAGSDTIGGVAGATGIKVRPGERMTVVCWSAGAWSLLPDTARREKPNPRGLVSWRRALAKVIQKKSPAFVLCVGDSTTAGAQADLSGGSTNGRYFSYVGAASRLLNAKGIKSSADAFFGSGMATPTTLDSRLSLGAGWNYDIVNTVGGHIFYNNSTTNALAFTPIGAFDRIRVFYMKESGAGSVTIDIGGSALTTISQNGSYGYYYEDVNTGGAAATGTVNVKRVSGTTYLMGVAVWDSANPSVVFINAGAQGWTTADWASSSSAYSPKNGLSHLPFDLATFLLGANDRAGASPAVSVTSFRTNLDALATEVAANAVATAVPSVLFITPSISNPSAVSNPVSLATQAQYNDAVKAAALAASAPCIDWAELIGTYDATLYPADDVHPGYVHQGDLGRVLADYIS